MSALTWRPVEASDAEIIFNENKGNIAKYFYEFKDLDEARKWVNEAIKKHAEGVKLEYMLFEDNEFIGMISPCYLSKEKVEIAIWIVESKQGKSYGKRALSELLERLHTEGVKEVIYETDSDNVPSINLAISLGFTTSDESGFKYLKKL